MEESIMNIRILHGLEGAKQAIGVTVIIDVFRAFTVEMYLMNTVDLHFMDGIPLL